MNKLKKIFLCLLCLTFITTIFFTFKPKAVKSDTQYKIKVSSTCTKEEKAGRIYYSPSGSTIKLTITCEGITDNDTQVTISYKTQDYTAMAAKNEYTSASGTKTFTKYNDSFLIYLYVSYSRYGIEANGKVTNNSFIFRLYNESASDGGIVEIEDKYRYTYCCVNYSTKYSLSYYNNWYVYSEYANSFTLNLPYKGRLDKEDTTHWYRWTMYDTVYDSRISTFRTKFVNKDLGNLYISGSLKQDGNHTWHWDDDEVEFTLGNSYDDWFYYYNWEDLLDDDTANFGGSGDYSNHYNNSWSASLYNRKAGSSTWIYVPYKNSGYIYLTYDCKDGTRMEFYDGKISFALSDSKEPIPTYWTIAADDLTINDYIYISVRFNEAVQVEGTPILKCYIDGSSKNLIDFKYDGGSYTDTLVFKCKASDLVKDSTKTLNCTKIYPQELVDISGSRAKIFDFCQDSSGYPLIIKDYKAQYSTMSAFKSVDTKNPCDPDSLKCPLNCQIDLRLPQTSVSKEFENSISKQHEARIQITNTSKDTIIYYTWSKSATPFNVDITTNKGLDLYDNYYINSNANEVTGNILTFANSTLNGEYYLHYLTVSKFGRTSGDQVVKASDGSALKFDNSEPVVTKTTLTNDTYLDKTIELEISEGPSECPSNIHEIYMYYTTNIESLQNIKNSGIVDENMNKIKLLGENVTTPKINVIEQNKKYQMVLNAQDQYIDLKQDEYNTYYIGFVFVDNAGNYLDAKNIEFKEYQFDRRDLFETTFTVNTTQGLIHSVKEDRTYIFNTTATNQFTISKVELDAGTLTIDRIVKDGEQVNQTDLFSNQENTESYIKLTTKANITGHYSISVKYNTKISQTYELYFSSSLTDKTYNKNIIDSTGVLINYVYQLKDPVFYYKNLDEKVVSDEFYGDINLSPSFSSIETCEQYVRFFEQQDFELYYIKDASWASALRNENIVPDRTLAQGETHVPQVGDYYIRYKKKDWQVGDTTSSNWVYYYYETDEETINMSNISNILKDALDSVTKRIVANGEYVFLTNEYLDAFGGPYLNPKQYHVENLVANESKQGSKFKNSITFSKDDAIFSSYINYNDGNYRLLSNYEFVFNRESKIFYKMRGTNQAYKELELYQNRLRPLLEATGVYEIVECDEEGINIFNCFVDCTSPVLEVQSVARDKQEGEEYDETEKIPQIINAEFDGKTFTAKTFSFIALTEDDPYSYVAVYKIQALSTPFYKVFSRTDIEGLNAELKDGNFLVKIYDRSGNNFTLTIRANESDLKVEVIENPNNYISIECNRETDQIKEYQIYRNGELIKSLKDYQQKVRFYETGAYDIYIEDWYGNYYKEVYEFDRSLPDIKWKYDKGTTSYIYDGSQSGIRLISESQQKSTIYTNGTLSVIYPMGNDYAYKFNGVEPVTSKTTLANGDVCVKIDSNEDYEIELFYADYPDIKIIYSVFYDNRSPIINVSSEEYEFVIDSEAELTNYMKERMDDPSLIDPSLDKTKYHPTKLGYSVDESDSTLHYISSGGITSSKLINVTFEDESYVTEVTVKLDGVTIDKYEDYNGINGFSLSRAGKYLIEAKDSLGNVTEFTFTNMFGNRALAYVDDNLIDTTKKGNNYGSETFKFETKEKGTIEFLVEFNDTVLYYVFNIEENMSMKEYHITYDSTNLEQGGIKYDRSTQVYSPGSSDTYSFGKNDGINFIFYNINDTYTFLFTTDQSNEYKVSVLSYDLKFQPYYAEAYLSYKESPVNVTSNGTVYDLSKSAVAYLNHSFRVINPSTDDKITKVTIESENMEVRTIYTKEDGFIDDEYFDNDFYIITVDNVYGVSGYFIVFVSNEFNIIKTVRFSDGTTYNYTENYNETLYSNYRIEIIVESVGPEIYVTKDGKKFDPIVVEELNQTKIIVESDGIYSFEIIDIFGNDTKLNAIIKNEPISFPEKILVGYEQKALLKDQGYTKNLLSFDAHTVYLSSLYSIDVTYKGNTKVYYDYFGETKIDPTQEELNKIIGIDGDGEYLITVRDNYGNKASKTIHYSSTPTLSLSRTTRSNGNFEDYDLEFAISENGGFYANNSLRFTTTSINYKFLIDGKQSELDKTLTFVQGMDKGTLEYMIYYLDEYGYEYTFNAYLYRTDVELQAKNIEDFKEINTLLTTNKNFTIEFTKNATCTYTLNGKTYDYHEGDVIKQDGVYRFTVVDFAGNIKTETYKKDSICEYSFIDSYAAKTLVSGDIANSNRVQFNPANGDSTMIDSIYFNGEILKDYKDDKFDKAGHYEFIIRDEVGNTSYFEFYIYSHAVKGIEYKTPYTYVVKTLTYTTEYGGTISVLGYVTQNEYDSSFSFGSITDEIKKSEDGYYECVMYSPVFGNYSSFNFTIDNVSPLCELDGCNENEETINNVTLTGYKVGDTIKVYKDGTLIKTTVISTSSSDAPIVTEGGNYVFEITNEAGLTQKLAFTRIHTANAAGSTLIILGVIVFAIVLFIGLMYRTKSKVDK